RVLFRSGQLKVHYWPENYEVMAVEMHFELPYEGMPGWTRSGTMDLVVRDMDTGRLVGDDQKFTRKQWNKKKVEPSQPQAAWYVAAIAEWFDEPRSEEHTSELQSRENIVCRFLLEEKNTE